MNKDKLKNNKVLANLFHGIERLIWHVRNEKKPLSWVASRILFYSGAGRFLPLIVVCIQ